MLKTSNDDVTTIDEKEPAESAVSEPDIAEAEAQVAESEPKSKKPKSKEPESDELEAEKASPKSDGRRISISVRSLAIVVLIVGWVATAGILTWMYLGEKSQVNAAAQQSANNAHAEQLAIDYAAKAAKIDYKDLEGWKKHLVENTTPELRDKLTDAGKSMEQLLVPLQWNSTATPLMAKVRSVDKGVYVVDTFVGVNTKTMQAPEGLQSTATYKVTVDSNKDWQISEVGGIGSVVGQR